MTLRTIEQFIDVAASTPSHEAVGMTALEIRNLERSTGRECNSLSRLCGRRIVRIPWDWERQAT